MLPEVVEQVCALFEWLVAAIYEAGEHQYVLASGWIKLSRCLVPVVWDASERFLLNLQVLGLTLPLLVMATSYPEYILRLAYRVFYCYRFRGLNWIFLRNGLRWGWVRLLPWRPAKRPKAESVHESFDLGFVCLDQSLYGFQTT